MQLAGEREPLKILRIATDLYPDVLGGGALHAHEMSNHQSEMGHNVTVITSDHRKSQPIPDEERTYDVKRYREVAKIFGNSITPGMLRSVPGLLERFDVVHAHSHLYFSTNITAALSKIRDIPLVITNHGLHSQTAPALVQRLYVPTVARFSLNAADRVLCYTTTDRDRLRERAISAPISVIHNGIDCSQFRPLADVSDQNQLLFVGRLKRSKGVHRLVDAFGALSREYPELSLKIVGTGPMRSELARTCTEYEIGNRVVFTGRLSNDELPRIYNESTVFVLPSTAEGLPRTVLEALACRTPVVTSDLPQLEPVVDGVGTTVPAASVDALADAIAGLLDEPDRRARMGERGRERVVAKYSWAETVQQTTDVYYELLS